MKRRKTIELLQTLYSSSLDVNFRRLVLQVSYALHLPVASTDYQAMEQIMLLAPAVMSLVHRNHFLNWLETQWMLSESSPTRGVEEERGRYFSIMDSAVIVLASRDKSKSAKLAAKAAEVDDGEEAGVVAEDKKMDEEEVLADKEWSLKNRDWAGSIERLVTASVGEAGELHVAVERQNSSQTRNDSPFLFRLSVVLQTSRSYPLSSDFCLRLSTAFRPSTPNLRMTRRTVHSLRCCSR